MNPLLFMLVCFGLIAVGLCFLFLMPIVANTIVVLISIFFGEKAYSIINKKPSDSVFRDPNEAEDIK